MRVEYINPFVEAAFKIIGQVIDQDATRGKLYLKSVSQPVLGVAVIVGLAGDVEGRVLFDMSEETALAVASAMNGEKLTQMNQLVKETIMELANMITASAVTKLQDLGFSFDLTPPAIFTGVDMEISNNGVEALIVPMEISQGKIEINVAIRERI
jgi:chemotaxis protein CheX